MALLLCEDSFSCSCVACVCAVRLWAAQNVCQGYWYLDPARHAHVRLCCVHCCACSSVLCSLSSVACVRHSPWLVHASFGFQILSCLGVVWTGHLFSGVMVCSGVVDARAVVRTSNVRTWPGLVAWQLHQAERRVRRADSTWSDARAWALARVAADAAAQAPAAKRRQLLVPVAEPAPAWGDESSDGEVSPPRASVARQFERAGCDLSSDGEVSPPRPSSRSIASPQTEIVPPVWPTGDTDDSEVEC